MGYSVSWVARRGKDPSALCEELGLRGTGEFEATPASKITMATLETGWSLVVANGDPFRYNDDALLERLSTACELVACIVEEHSMVSWAAAWRDAQMRWELEHAGYKGRLQLDVRGKLPRALAATVAAERQRISKSRSPADLMFEVPPNVAKQITGYRHDARSGVAGKTGFEVMSAAKRAPRAKSPRAPRLQQMPDLRSRVLWLLLKHPDWPKSKIAKAAGCSVSFVYSTG